MYEKMRIRHGGDAIRTGTWVRKHLKTSQTLRNNSCVQVSLDANHSYQLLTSRQYEVTFGHKGERKAETINYGVLENILLRDLGGEKVWDELHGMTQLLAVITPWRMNGEDAAVQTVFRA